MHHFFVEPSQIQGNHIFIDGPDVNHIRNVLRMNPREEVNVTDGSWREGLPLCHCRHRGR